METSLFCETCFETTIVPRAELKKRDISDGGKTYQHFYLFDWAPGESDLLSKLVYQLKSDRCAPGLKYYADIISEQLKQNDFLGDRYQLVIPLPGSKKSSVHSNIIAKQIAERLKLPYSDLLRKKSGGKAQKQRSRSQRAANVIMLKSEIQDEQITTFKSCKPQVIYVDDVLTTGNTFISSRDALGLGGQACVVTLFYRPHPQDIGLQT